MLKYIVILRKPTKSRGGMSAGERLLYGIVCCIALACIYPVFTTGEPWIALGFAFSALCCGYAALSR
tara:strand:- start:898 stop:1098 length:201 start_codon:yes stop_codon:yes gene_type:complete